MRNVVSSKTLERAVEGFSREQLRLVVQNIGAIQLTEGCNTGCRDCGVGAKPGVSDFIPFDFLEEFFHEFAGDFQKSVYLYFASEPFDYRDGTRTYPDVHRLSEQVLGVNPCVYTSLPKGMEELILCHLLEKKNVLENMGGSPKSRFIDQINLTSLNSMRFERFLSCLPFIQENNQQIVESRYSEKICLSEYNGVLDQRHVMRVLENEEGIIAQLGCGRDHFFLGGNKRAYYLGSNLVHALPVLGLSSNLGRLYIARVPNGDVIANESEPVGWRQVNNYLGDGLGVAVFSFLTFDREKPHDLRLGPSNVDALDDEGIACFHGVVMTPLGFFNVQVVRPDKHYPYGMDIKKITPEDFRVAKYHFHESACLSNLRAPNHDELFRGDLGMYRELAIPHRSEFLGVPT